MRISTCLQEQETIPGSELNQLFWGEKIANVKGHRRIPLSQLRPANKRSCITSHCPGHKYSCKEAKLTVASCQISQRPEGEPQLPVG